MSREDNTMTKYSKITESDILYEKAKLLIKLLNFEKSSEIFSNLYTSMISPIILRDYVFSLISSKKYHKALVFFNFFLILF